MTPRRATTTITALAVAALALTGCTGKPDPDATSTATAPTPTVTTPDDPLVTSPEEATSAYLNYVAVRNQVRQDYYRDWETKYVPLTTGEEMDTISQAIPSRVADGYHQVGDVVVVTGPQIVSYDDSDAAGNYEARMTGCVDTSGSEMVSQAHSFRAYPDGRFEFEVLMQRVVNYDSAGQVKPDPLGQGWWRVDTEHSDPQKPC